MVACGDARHLNDPFNLIPQSVGRSLAQGLSTTSVRLGVLASLRGLSAAEPCEEELSLLFLSCFKSGLQFNTSYFDRRAFRCSRVTMRVLIVGPGYGHNKTDQSEINL